MVVEEILVTKVEAKTKFIDFAVQNITEIPSRKGIRKAIERGYLLLNSRKVRTDTWLKNGDKIELLQSNLYSGKIFKLKLDVIYEDNYLAIINKPAGFPVSGNQFKTITNSLAFNLKPSDCSDRLPKIHPVHRLDSLTSGLLICAKTIRTTIELGKMFKKKKIKKKYQALVIGSTADSGIIDLDIDNCPSQTEFTKMYEIRTLQHGIITQLELSPKTGRTHQLRIHTSKSGFPILGDPLYPENADFARYKGKGLFLCATYLNFIHPITGKNMEFSIEPPSKFTKYLERESKRWAKYNE
jgi:RluA family pseudouridine synthase